jgi:beta-fructofuranosidase
MGNAEEADVIQPTVKHHWIHALTIPHEPEWKNETLYQHPVEELQQLRLNEVYYPDVKLDEAAGISLSDIKGNVFELLVEVNHIQATDFSIEIGTSVRISYNATEKVFTFEREKLNQSKAFESRHCHLEQLNSIHVYKDSSSIEIFINDGAVVFSSRVFDASNNEEITFTVNGHIQANVTKWDLKRVTC